MWYKSFYIISILPLTCKKKKTLMATGQIVLGQSYTQMQLIAGYKRKYSYFAA
jgi:hypothetical protein